MATPTLPEVRDNPPAPEPEPITVDWLPLPPISPSDTGIDEGPAYLHDGEHVLLMVTFAGASDDERPTENHVVLVKTGGGAFASGDPWKCLTRGVPAENQAGRNAPLDHPQPFPDGRRALVGTNVLDGSPHLLTSDDCKPETTRIFPVRWNVTADGSGPGTRAHRHSLPSTPRS